MCRSLFYNAGPEGYPIIQLDINEPWKNPEGIFVVRFDGFKYEGNLYKGIDIRIAGDPRDVNADRLELKKYKDNQGKGYRFVLTTPAIPATLWMDREDYEEDLDDDVHEVINLGYKTALVSYLGKRKGAETEQEKEQKKKKFLLHIKDDNGQPLELSDAPFRKPNMDPEMVQRHYFTTLYPTGNTIAGRAQNNMSAVVSWRFVDMTPGSFKPMNQTEKVEDEGRSEMDKKLAERARKRAAKAAKVEEHG